MLYTFLKCLIGHRFIQILINKYLKVLQHKISVFNHSGTYAIHNLTIRPIDRNTLDCPVRCQDVAPALLTQLNETRTFKTSRGCRQSRQEFQISRQILANNVIP